MSITIAVGVGIGIAGSLASWPTSAFPFDRLLMGRKSSEFKRRLKAAASAASGSDQGCVFISAFMSV